MTDYQRRWDIEGVCHFVTGSELERLSRDWFESRPADRQDFGRLITSTDSRSSKPVSPAENTARWKDKTCRRHDA